MSRSYLYQIATRRTAFNKKHVWWVKDRLNLGAMNQAANLLVGRHDFAAFSEHDAKRDGQSTIVVIQEAAFEQADYLILFHIEASHFLWKMVRRLVGSLVEVGRGKVSVAEFEALLNNPKVKTALDPARVTAPPSGLFLERIVYEPNRS